jgi:hypothetical protein
MRYIVWACFGVDADSPEHAKEIVGYLVDSELSAADRIGLFDKYRVNPIVFVSPEFDKLIGMAVKKAKKGG